MKKYRDNEVQKLIQLNTSTTGNEAVRLEDIPRLLRTLGYEEVPPEVVQECAALVHLVNLDLAAGIRPLCSTFTFDGLYHFMENLRASHGFINAERVDLKNAFLRFSTEKFSKSGFIEDDSSTAEDEEAQISVLKLFHALRWLGYQVELWQVLEKMDGIGMVGSASLCQEEFMRVMAGLHRQELECIQEMLQESPEIQRVNSEASAGIAPADQEVQAGPVTAKRLKVLFQQLGYSMPGSELVGLSKEFAQGYFPQDVWGVAQVLRRHRNKVRDEVRKNFGFARAELRGLQEAFEQLARPAGTLQGKQLSLAVRQLFPGAEKERLERQRAHQTIKQVTKSRACEELDFQEFLHLVRLCLDREAEAKLNEEHQALERLPFVASEVTEFRTIFHGVALQEKSKASEQCTSILGNVSAIPCLSYIAVEAMLAGITGDVSELTREALQEILLAVDMEKKGSLYFWEFLEAVRALMDENWHSINDEAQKMVLESWAQKEADALYKSRAESARLDET
ncbi:unnamed protein product [Effrenium voratum]|nr:unnamed protein product [Effrenium voratum]